MLEKLSISLVAGLVIQTGMIISGCPASAAEPSAISGYKINQKSCYLGETEVQVCAAGLKILRKANRNEVITVCPSPFDKIYVYSLKLKKVYVAPTAKYRNYLCNRLNFIAGNFVSDGTTLTKSGGAMILGRRCDVYKSSAKFALEQRKIHEQGESTHESIMAYIVTAEPTLINNAQEAAAIYRIYGLAAATGMPLTARQINVEDSETEVLRTSAVTKSIFKPSEFGCPTGFTPVKDEHELVVDLRNTEDSIPLF